MVMWLAIIIIIVLILVDSKEARKQKELDNQIVGYNTKNGRPILRKNVNILEYDIRTGQPIFEYKKKVIGYDPNTGEEIFEGDKIPEPIVPKGPLTQEDKTRISNTILMVAGAILVVIASIIFLASSWESIPGLLKTLTLFGIQMVFYLFSSICNNKLNIPKVGKMFKYLTFAFTPVVLLSLSLFELIGDYFSFRGDGYYLYIGITCLITDAVYKLCSNNPKDLYLKRTSFIFEIVGLLFLVQPFEMPFLYAFILVFHNIILYMLLQGNYLDKEAYEGLHDAYTYLLILIVLSTSSDVINIGYFTNFILLALNFFVRCLNTDKDMPRKINLIGFFISYLLAIKIIEEIDMNQYFLYLLSLIPIFGLIKIVKTESMKKNILRVIGALTTIITVISIFNGDTTVYYMLSYLISFIIFGILFLLTKSMFYKLTSYISFSLIFFAICDITGQTEIAKYILVIMPILVYFLEMVFEQLKHDVSRLYIFACLCISTLVFVESYELLIPLVLMVIYALQENIRGTLIIPMIGSIFILSLPDETFIDMTFLTLTVVYTFLSVYLQKYSKYTFFSLITLAITCINMEISAYFFWGVLTLWGFIHYLVNKGERSLYTSAMVFGIFGLYVKALLDADTSMFATYALGIYLTSITMTKGVFKKANVTLMGILECIVIGIVTLVAAVVTQDALDGLLVLGILFMISIFSYNQKWKYYMYSSIVSMIFGVFFMTAEYWKEIPWYVYILIIGLGLIVFAMFDEKRKQSKEQALVNPTFPVNNQQTVVTPPTIPVFEQPSHPVVPTMAGEPIVSSTPVVEEKSVPEEIPVVNDIVGENEVVESQPILTEEPKVDSSQAVESTKSVVEVENEIDESESTPTIEKKRNNQQRRKGNTRTQRTNRGSSIYKEHYKKDYNRNKNK